MRVEEVAALLAFPTHNIGVPTYVIFAPFQGSSDIERWPSMTANPI
jgi:hypothetical protein